MVVLVVTIRFTSKGVLQHQIFVYTYKTFKHLFIYVRLVFSFLSYREFSPQSERPCIERRQHITMKLTGAGVGVELPLLTPLKP